MPADRSRDRVMLVHGLWYGAVSLLPLARRLNGAGFRVHRHSWPTTRRDFLDSADRLFEAADVLAAGRLHLVGHSLGGLLILKMLERAGSALPPGRVVLLGSPVRGSNVARRMAATRGLGRMLGSARGVLTGGFAHAPEGRETAVVAGTVSVGAGRLLGRLDKPHDGTVSVGETRLPGSVDQLDLPVSHTGLLLSRTVARQVESFLRDGVFTD